MFSQFLQQFIGQVVATPLLEWLAIVAAVAEVLLARANNVLLYPAGIISTLLYTYLFLRPETRLYADSMLNSYYFVMSILGWIWWSTGKNKILTITRLGKREWIKTSGFTLLGWWLLYVLLTRIFPATIPYYVVSEVASWDAFVSAAAWAGMWLLSRRKTENWIFLNISNAFAVPLFLYKKMPFTAALTVFLFIMALQGYKKWKQLSMPN